MLFPAGGLRHGKEGACGLKEIFFLLKYFEEHRIFVCLIGIGKYFNEIASDNRKVLRGSAGMKELIDYVADVSEMTGTELEFLCGR